MIEAIDSLESVIFSLALDHPWFTYKQSVVAATRQKRRERRL